MAGTRSRLPRTLRLLICIERRRCRVWCLHRRMPMSRARTSDPTPIQPRKYLVVCLSGSLSTVIDAISKDSLLLGRDSQLKRPHTGVGLGNPACGIVGLNIVRPTSQRDPCGTSPQSTCLACAAGHRKEKLTWISNSKGNDFATAHERGVHHYNVLRGSLDHI